MASRRSAAAPDPDALMAVRAAARALARGPTWKRRLARFGVVEVGFGRRASGPRQEFGDELCVLLFVRRKWRRRPRATPDSAVIPRSFRLRLTIDGKRRTHVVPVDVRAVASITAHATIMTVSPKGSPQYVEGTPCALVAPRKHPAEVSVLSCLHVFGGPRWVPGGDVDAFPRIGLGPVTPDGLPADELRIVAVTAAQFDDAARFDAARAQVHPAALPTVMDRAFWPALVPKRVAQSIDEILLQGAWSIPTPRNGAVADCRWAGGPHPQTFRSPSGRLYRIASVVQVEFTKGATAGGDSGAPVLYGSILAGMHLGADANSGYFAPAPEIFTRAFDDVLVLVPVS